MPNDELLEEGSLPQATLVGPSDRAYARCAAEHENLSMNFNKLERAAAEAISDNRVQDAIRIYLFMSDGDPSLDGGYLAERIGKCYETLKDIPAARFWYGRAVEENPEVRVESRNARERLGSESYDQLLRLGSNR